MQAKPTLTTSWLGCSTDRSSTGRRYPTPSRRSPYSKAAGHHTGRARELNAVGWFHAQLGDYEQGLACCQEALDVQREIGDLFGQAETLRQSWVMPIDISATKRRPQPATSRPSTCTVSSATFTTKPTLLSPWATPIRHLAIASPPGSPGNAHCQFSSSSVTLPPTGPSQNART